jgi:3-hydroxybutyryl-CoA dehydrogenase
MRAPGSALVVGGGTMGAGIVQVLLGAGVRVQLAESSPELAARVEERLRTRLDAGDADRLVVTVGFDDATDVVLAIEAVPEDVAVKQEILTAIEAVAPADCVVATNTSSLSINGLAAGLARPDRFIGMHFFNPVPKSALVELVLGTETSPKTLEAARAWVTLLGKEHIEVRDSPGFATSRLGLVIGLEAIRMVEEGVASPHDIDRGMELGYRFPMGPLRLTDLVGLDVRLAIAEHLSLALGPRFEPPDLLRRKVAAGELGKKTGKGFYEW